MIETKVKSVMYIHKRVEPKKVITSEAWMLNISVFFFFFLIPI